MFFAAAAPEPKDVVTAAIAASAAFAGLVLVFVGVIAAVARTAQQEHIELRREYEDVKRLVDQIDRESGGPQLGLGIGEGFVRLSIGMRKIGPFAWGLVLRAAYLTFVLSLIDIASGIVWLASPGATALYHITFWFFLVELLALLGLIGTYRAALTGSPVVRTPPRT